MTTRTLRRWWKYRPGRLGRNALYGTTSFGIRAVVQAAYLLIASRWLGAEGYGLFSGSVALAILGAPIATWGSLMIVTRYVARDRGISRALWATALTQICTVGGLLVLGLFTISFLIPERLAAGPMVMLGISELVLLPITWAAASLCNALEHGKGAAIAICLIPIVRVASMLLAIAFDVAATPANAASAHFFGSVFAGIAAILLVAHVDGWPAWNIRMRLRDALKEGAPYAASNVAGSNYFEVDKFLMLQILGAAVVGPYTVAFRIASIFVMPMTALISATLPRLMARAGTTDGAQTYRVMLLTGVGYGSLVAVCIFVFSPWVPRIFGSDYALATHYLGLLALWPGLFAVRHGLATHLTANHRQAIRSYIEIASLIFVVLMNLLLLPRLGPEAAVFSLLLTEVLTAILMGACIKRVSKVDPNRGV